MHQMVNDEIRKSILILLRPLVQVNFVLGTCPCLISPEGQIKTPFKIFNFARFFFILACFLAFSISAVVRAFCGIYTPELSEDAGTTVKGKEVISESFSLATFVDMACGFYMNLMPAVFLCMASFKRKQISAFFDTMTKYVNAIIGFSDYTHVKMITTRLYLFHCTVALIMTGTMVTRFLAHPETGPGNMAIWFFTKGQVNPQLILWISAPLVIFMNAAKAAVLGLIEIPCVSLACCFCKVIENVEEYMDDIMRSLNVRFLDFPLTTSILQSRPVIEKERTSSANGDGKARKIQLDIENYLEQMRRYNRGDYPLSCSFNDGNKLSGELYEQRGEFTPGQQIIHIIYKFQAIRNMQTATNALFGIALALNTGMMVFASVVLKYMLIWNFGNLMRHYDWDSEGNYTQLGNESSKMAMQDANRHVTMLTNSPSEWAMFGVIEICFSLRLFILVVCLGNVHFTSQKFNSKLSKALLQAQKIGDIVEVQGTGNKYFQGRQIITLKESNTILAFITENSANPMAFSAAGLFCFSRNLILVIISIIITYLVFLLQV